MATTPQKESKQITSPNMDAILLALKHPVMEYANPGINGGLSGSALVDNIIGVMERARDYVSGDPILEAGYTALKREYPESFTSFGNGVSRGGSRQKPDAYKAINGFGH